MRFKSRQLRVRRAFTLLEVCVVLAIIIMLSALAFAALVKRQRPEPAREPIPAREPVAK